MAVDWIRSRENSLQSTTDVMKPSRVGSSNPTTVGSEKECQVCGRNFSRTEHRARHMLTHTREKPFVCPLCDEQFQRADVLRRHITKYCPRLNETIDSMVASEWKARARVKVACDYCHSKKLKCNGESPCQKCVSRYLPCTYQRDTQRRSSAHSASPQLCHVSKPISPISQLSSTENQINEKDMAASLAVEGSVSSLTQLYERPPKTPLFRTPNLPNIGLGSAIPSDTSMETPVPIAVEDHDCYGGSLTNASANLSQPHEFQHATYSNYLDAFSIFDNDSDLSTWMDLDMSNLPAFGTCFNQPSVPSELASDGLVGRGLESLLKVVSARGQVPSAKQEQLETWLKRPFIPRQYDLDVLEALIQVFRRHVQFMFASFRDLEISSHTTPAQVLAMAAVGALFSDCAGSEVIAKLYFTDSQRLLNRDMETTADSLEKSTSLLQAYISLELFGLCSGHKRSNEVSEAYHAGLIQFMTDHLSWLDIANPADVGASCRDILLDLLVLEAYRVTLLQLQPILLPPHVQVIRNLLGSLESRNPQQQASSPSLGPFCQQLACICAMSWFAIARSEGDPSSPVRQCWRVETFELYWQRLSILSGSELDKSPSARILMFTNLLSLHAPLEHFHDVAYSFSQRDIMTRNDTSMRLLRRWQQGDDYDLALAHADQVLECGEIILSKESQHYEAPHDAICVYIATLVFWISGLTRAEDLDGHTDLSRRVGKGIQLLTKFRVKVSGVMRQILVLLHAMEERIS